MIRRFSLAFLIILSIFSFVSPVAASGDLPAVYYAGDPNSTVLQSLKLANFEIVDNPTLADVILLNGEAPDMDQISGQVQHGAGLVLILGTEITATDVEQLLGFPVSLEKLSDPISLTNIKIEDPLTTEIIWNSAPQVRDRYKTLTPVSSVQPLVTNYADGEWLLWQAHPNAFVVNIH